MSRVARRASTELLKYSQDFGMTPSSRSRLDIKLPPKPNAFEDLVNGNKPRYRFGRKPSTSA